MNDQALGPVPRRSLHMLSQSTNRQPPDVETGSSSSDALEHFSADTAAHLQTLLILCQRIAAASAAEFIVRAGSGWVTLLQSMTVPSSAPPQETRSRKLPTEDVDAGKRHVVPAPSAPWFALSLRVQQAPEPETIRLLTQALRLALHVVQTGEFLRREEQSRRRVLEMQAELAHELRTPLTAISGFAQLLQRPGQLDEERRRNYAGIAVVESQQVTAIIDHLVAALQEEAEALGKDSDQPDELAGGEPSPAPP